MVITYQFKEERGHCKVPKGYDNDKELANWVRNQRLERANMLRGHKNRMSEERLQKLDALGFKWSSPVDRTPKPRAGNNNSNKGSSGTKGSDGKRKNGASNSNAKGGDDGERIVPILGDADDPELVHPDQDIDVKTEFDLRVASI